MAKISIRTFLEYLFHIPSHIQAETHYRETAERYHKSITVCEQTLSELSLQCNHYTDRCKDLERTLRQIITTAAGGLTSYIPEEKIYSTIAPCYDPDGEVLYSEAKRMWGGLDFNAHMDECWYGKYDNASDSDMFQYLLEDIKELDGEGPDFQNRLTHVYRNTLVMLDLLDNVHYVIPAHKTVPLICNERLTAEEVKALYQKNQKRYDAAGFHLFHAAEDLLGKFEESSFYFEANRGEFEVADGFKLLKYLLVQNEHQFGTQDCIRWERVDSSIPLERCADFTIQQTPEYAAFEEKLYRKVCLSLELMHTQKALEQELNMRRQMGNASEDLGSKIPAPLDEYTNEEIQAALAQ